MPQHDRSFIVRRASTDDVPAIARIWTEGWADGHTGHVPDALAPYRTEPQFVPRAADRVAATWVAESAGLVAGFVVVKADEVEQLYVDRSARGTGVAAALLHLGEEQIRGVGYRRAWLAVVDGNQRARVFYARHGWRDAGPISYLAETPDGHFPVPTRRYEIDLD